MNQLFFPFSLRMANWNFIWKLASVMMACQKFDLPTQWAKERPGPEIRSPPSIMHGRSECWMEASLSYAHDAVSKFWSPIQGKNIVWFIWMNSIKWVNKFCSQLWGSLLRKLVSPAPLSIQNVPRLLRTHIQSFGTLRQHGWYYNPFWDFSNSVEKKKKKERTILLGPMGVLAPGSVHAWPSAQPPIVTSRNFADI